MDRVNKIEDKVAGYYDKKIQEFGATSKGVDWNGIESQELRFEQLLKVVVEEQFALIDFGCGYGATYDYLVEREYKLSKYTGVDISEAMLAEAKALHVDCANFYLSKSIEEAKLHDYIIASGVFNVKQKEPNDSWKEYCTGLLCKFNDFSTKGFSFNMLTKYSDKEYMKDYLYYADPMFYFDYCKKHFSKDVALLHDYKLYEFTIIVRK